MSNNTLDARGTKIKSVVFRIAGIDTAKPTKAAIVDNSVRHFTSTENKGHSLLAVVYSQGNLNEGNEEKEFNKIVLRKRFLHTNNEQLQEMRSKIFRLPHHCCTNLLMCAFV